MKNYRKDKLKVTRPDGSVLYFQKNLKIDLEQIDIKEPDFYINQIQYQLEQITEKQSKINFLEQQKKYLKNKYRPTNFYKSLIEYLDIQINEYTEHSEAIDDKKLIYFKKQKRKYVFILNTTTQIQLAYEINRLLNYNEKDRNERKKLFNEIQNKITFNKEPEKKYRNLKDNFSKLDYKNIGNDDNLLNELKLIFQ